MELVFQCCVSQTGSELGRSRVWPFLMYCCIHVWFDHICGDSHFLVFQLLVGYLRMRLVGCMSVRLVGCVGVRLVECVSVTLVECASVRSVGYVSVSNALSSCTNQKNTEQESGGVFQI